MVPGLISLLFATSSPWAQETIQPWQTNASTQALKHSTHSSTRKVPITATSHTRSALARMPGHSDDQKEHHLILQVNTNDSAAMNLALNNASNVATYYKELGEKVKIEVITFGPGLHMLRDDTSPVKARIEEMALGAPEVSFKACGNTREKMQKAENKDIPIVPQAQVVKSGVVRVMQLQEQGWTYVKP
ncbi:DsrE family protein [Bradyrhizobium sp. UFLA05-112]